MKHFLLIATLLCAFVTQEVWAQTRTLSGVVRSASDEGELPGVNVSVKGSTVGTITDVNGAYTLTVPNNAETLVFSFVGFQSQEVAIGSRSVVDVSLKEDVQALSEVVITGYGERSKNEFTGAVSTLGADRIQNKPFATVDQALQGNVAGLQMASSSGTPGSSQNIRIRGISSITANNDPLFVIDGIPVVNGDNNRSTATGSLSILSSINNNDIESITVLKDASATALYGARGANGVIVITTKKGKSGKPVVTFSGQSGMISRAVPGPQGLSGEQWEELYYEARVNNPASEVSTIEEARTKYPNAWDGVTNTDWRDVITNHDAMTHDYNLSVRGGGEKSNYYVSGSYFQQDGINVGTDYERITGKVSYGNAITEKMMLQTTFNASYVTQNGQLEAAAYFGNPELATLFLQARDKPYAPDGTPNLDLLGIVFNPLYLAQNDINRRKQARVFNSTTFEYNILKNLKFTSVLGLDYLLTDELYYDNRNYGDGAGENGGSTAYMNRNFNWDWKNMLDYSWRLNQDHSFNLQAIFEAQKNNYYTIGAGGIGFAADGLYYPESIGTPDYVSAYPNDWAINSIMGLANYSFREKIFLDGTIRREGNSRFAPGLRWGTFYSVGASWVFTKEAFMQNLTWLNNSKLRASYGRTGNAGVGLNEYQAFLSYSGAYNGAAAVFPSQLGNQDLSWEKSDAFNIGLDFGLFNRINATVEYFHRTSSDLLLEVPLSYTTGFSSQTQNVGTMVNKGLEASIDGDVIRAGSFRWNLSANMTTLKNEVTELPLSAEGDEIGITTSIQKVSVGQPVYGWYMPTWAGVDTETGAPLWYVEGTSGETTSNYSAASSSFHGSFFPTFYGGLTNRLEYKGVYVSAQLYYSTGNSVYDTWAGYTLSDGQYTYTIANGYARLYDRWQKPGDISPNPKNIYGNTTRSNSNSTRRLYSDEYLRLRDLTIGYNLPASLLSKVGFSAANIYLKGNNIWTWVADKNLEFDPEVSTSEGLTGSARGTLNLTAAPIKTYSLGLTVSF
ncbi:TonB-linked outer membrane protein, SusC/RagA family [Catalinimonas alkaloidigena]|uniref:TonB-linked outer membrane protein, SusC/RagA family n=1 Tax=Catalinimonas alkaloidigena TaxID=1075417 RepID=A0A1G9GX27_9BACT|nr:TonB-dependent receptor [Catalinimonas alkaloidigena]SDL05142.1 TonB-linked outer membrane protein, SusC/RagA family [Catalinimonas alkaloidigena]